MWADEKRIMRLASGDEELVVGDQDSRRAAVLRFALEDLEGAERVLFVAAAARCERDDPDHFAGVSDELVRHFRLECACHGRLN